MPSDEHQAVLSAVVEAAAAAQGADERPIAEQRATFEAMAAAFPLADDVTLEPVDSGGVASQWVTPEGVDDRRVIIYLHGGGYFSGSITTHCELASRIARASDGRALVVDYRLAPEHPFPAALDDGLAVYRWLLSEGQDPGRTVIAGDSAGGGLTLATMLSLRNAGDRLPAAAVLLAPWVDLAAPIEVLQRRVASAAPIMTGDVISRTAAQYAAGADLRSPLLSPLYADLQGLPPLLVQIGTADAFLEEARGLVARARAAGTEAVLEEFAELMHVFQQLVPTAPETVEAISRIGSFILKHAT